MARAGKAGPPVEAQLCAVGGNGAGLVEHAVEPDVGDGRAILAHGEPHEVVDRAGRAIEAALAARRPQHDVVTLGAIG